jgi:hypothetical protein
VIVDRIASAAAMPSNIYLAAGIPQPLLRGRRTMRVPPRAIGAGIEAASIGARTGTFYRRVDLPGLDVDITACYAVGNALALVQDFLTHEVTAHHVQGPASLARLRDTVREVVGLGFA